MGGQGRCKTPDLPSEAKLVLEATRGSGHQCSLGQGGWVSLSLGRPNCSRGGAGETYLGHHWACNVPVACCSLDLLAKLLRCSLVIKRRIGCWSLRVEPCLLQLPPHVPSVPTHQETGLGMELEKIGSALKAVQSFEPE